MIRMIIPLFITALAGCDIAGKLPDLRPDYIPGVCANETHDTTYRFRANFDGALDIGSGFVDVVQHVKAEYISLGCEDPPPGPF